MVWLFCCDELFSAGTSFAIKLCISTNFDNLFSDFFPGPKISLKRKFPLLQDR